MRRYQLCVGMLLENVELLNLLGSDAIDAKPLSSFSKLTFLKWFGNLTGIQDCSLTDRET